MGRYACPGIYLLGCDIPWDIQVHVAGCDDPLGRYYVMAYMWLAFNLLALEGHASICIHVLAHKFHRMSNIVSLFLKGVIQNIRYPRKSRTHLMTEPMQRWNSVYVQT